MGANRRSRDDPSRVEGQPGARIFEYISPSMRVGANQTWIEKFKFDSPCIGWCVPAKRMEKHQIGGEGRSGSLDRWGWRFIGNIGRRRQFSQKPPETGGGAGAGMPAGGGPGGSGGTPLAGQQPGALAGLGPQQRLCWPQPISGSAMAVRTTAIRNRERSMMEPRVVGLPSRQSRP